MMSPVEVRHLPCIVSLLLPVCSPVSYLVSVARGSKATHALISSMADWRYFFYLAQQQKSLYPLSVMLSGLSSLSYYTDSH